MLPKNNHNPWTLLSTRQVYDNPWIQIREDQVLTPKKTNGIYGVVEFKNYAIGIIPIDQKGYTHLVGQYRYSLEEFSWEIPMGGGLRNQDILLSAQRELSEETGLTAKKWTLLCKLHTSNSVTDEVGFVYLAEELEEGQPHTEDTEELYLRKVHFSEVFAWCMQGHITDAITVAGVLHLAHLRPELLKKSIL
ncbi:MAG: NUDIX hydrolase [Cytophagales bacterium]|nr:MAG: NUDIX hydrolase [Cytophagales bacterium]TAF61086.1 MAG: NUDIX hydrolase [Cytophagales bacterium]